MSRATEIIHGIPMDPLTGSISTPVYQTSTFVQEAPGVNKGYDYARTNNPTRKVLEDLIARLEHGHAGFAFATGLAAIDSIVKTLSAGDKILAVDDLYGGAYRLFTHVYQKLAIEIDYVDTTDVQNVRQALDSRTRIVWLETPTNPTLKVSDIAAIAEAAHQNGALLVVDNTFASPLKQNPISLGADYVIHSATKYIAGHSDLVGGLVITAREELSEQIKFNQNASGAVLGPWDCFLTLRGIETLPLRFSQQSKSALAIAEFLTECEAVDKVYYPSLKSHLNHAFAIQQQGNECGGVVSFTLKEDTIQAAESLVSSTKLFKLAESLGGVKSLICQPAQMTHASIPRDKRITAGVDDSLIRISCGIEETHDLIDDLRGVLVHASKKEGVLAG